ncbi:MAG: cation diffusion facilitator family transporter [Acetatifactor sp.]|nr:cation diffusion facilitator family transporter [Acetatifactor sp.]
MDRSKKIVQTSIVGIVVNLLLVSLKMLVGLAANSIAVILDAVNNLGDALSSIITIIGVKLSGKAPDKKHPYGYGRIEYLTAVIIAGIVLAAGATSLKESVIKILHPEQTEYTVVSLIIIVVAVFAKLGCGLYVKGVGEKLHAPSLVASGSDAFFDSILSTATFIGALVSMVWKVQPEGILGLLISVFIIKAGIEMLTDTLENIIGVRTDSSLSQELKELITGTPGVHGAYDLILHNYGPMTIIGSVHIEVDDDLRAKEIHKLARMIATKVYDIYGIILTVGIYASNNSDEKLLEIKEELAKVVGNHPEILQMHGFYGEEESKNVTCDLIFDFNADAQKLRRQVEETISAKYPEYHFSILIDADFSD